MFYFKSKKIKKMFLKALSCPLNMCGLEHSMEAALEADLSFGMLHHKKDHSMFIALYDRYAFFDFLGEIVEAGGYYAKFMDFDSSVAELERLLYEDIFEIINGNLDVLYLGDHFN